jgi:hypothetical protein
MEELHGKAKVPKETKQNGELNNHKTSNDGRFRFASDGTYEYSIPPPPIITADMVGTQVYRKNDGTYAQIDTENGFYGLIENTNLVYGPHGIRNEIINQAESILKGTKVENQKAMGVVWLARVALSTTKKYLGTDGHGENSLLSSIGYGLLANLKPTTADYFSPTLSKVGNTKLNKVLEASHEAHHLVEATTFTKFSIKGANSTLGKWKINPLNTQFGGAQIEQEYFSGKRIWYAFNSHGASNGGHGAPASGHGASAGEHAQQKIENEGHRTETSNSHEASSVEHHANAEPTPEVPNNKDEAAELVQIIGSDKANRRTLYIAAALNAGKRTVKDPDSDGEIVKMIQLDSYKLAPDVQYTMALLKKSELSYEQATHTTLADAPQNIINYVSEMVSPYFDYFRLVKASFGLSGDDAKNTINRHTGLYNNPFYEQQVKEMGGTIINNPDGSKTVKVDPRKAFVRQKVDNTYVKKPAIPKLLSDVKKEKEKSQLLFGQTAQNINAYNIERQTGIKAGTYNNPLSGQPYATNLPGKSVFNNNNVGSNRTTISQNRNPFSK